MKPITDEKEWGEFLDELFRDQPVDSRGSALPTVSQRDQENMEVAR